MNFDSIEDTNNPLTSSLTIWMNLGLYFVIFIPLKRMKVFNSYLKCGSSATLVSKTRCKYGIDLNYIFLSRYSTVPPLISQWKSKSVNSSILPKSKRKNPKSSWLGYDVSNLKRLSRRYGYLKIIQEWYHSSLRLLGVQLTSGDSMFAGLAKIPLRCHFSQGFFTKRAIIPVVRDFVGGC